jgi:hypothetical protein
MNEEDFSSLRDAAMRRELTADEEQRLAACLRRHPERADDWRTEMALAHGLRRLPDRPIPSNFTARVVSTIERELSRGQPSRGFGVPRWRTWLPSRPWAVSCGVLAILIGGGTFWHVRQENRREYVRHVAALRALADIPPVVLEDFDAIRRFGESSTPVDYELLAALQ